MATCWRLCDIGRNGRFIPMLTQMCQMSKVNIKHPRPRLMERRVLEAITEPVYREQFPDPSRLCSIKYYEKKLQEQKHTTHERQKLEEYERFLVREALKVFEENRMILAVQAESMNGRKRQAVGFQLRSAGVHPVTFQHDILKQAIDGTKWENFRVVLHRQTLLLSSEQPRISDFISLSKKIPELTLLGGLVDGVMLTRAGLERYAVLPGLDGLRSELCCVLSSLGSRTHTILSHHQGILSRSLDQYITQNSSAPSDSVSPS